MKKEEKRFVSIVQVANANPSQGYLGVDEWDVFKWQQDCAHRYNLPVTVAITYPVLLNPDWIEDLKGWVKNYGDEVSFYFDTFIIPEWKCSNNFFHNLPVVEKRKVIDMSFRKFYSVFGKYPASIAFFQFDAPTLNYIKKKYPDVKAAITSCFEEGMNAAYRGHKFRDSRLEFINCTEGSPWWPWIPFKENSLCPAGEEDEKIDIVSIPWLVRDMILSFDSRNDFYSSELGDLLRSKSVKEGDISYVHRFFDEYMTQAQYNEGYAFYMMLQEANWFAETLQCYDEPPAVFKKLYEEYLSYLATKMREGAAKFVYLGEFADWFKTYFNNSTPKTICLWNDIRFHSGKQYLWYLDENFRILFALNQGGSITDFRPYVAKIKKSVGIDSPDLWDHTYPYLIQGHHRHCSIFKCLISYQEETVDLSEKIVKLKQITRGDKETKIELAPVRINFSNLSFNLQTTYTIKKGATIEVERNIIESSSDAEVNIEEHFVGCFGTEDSPTNLKGIKLILQTEDKFELNYEHHGRKIVKEDVKSSGVYIPEIALSLTLVPDEKAKEGFVWEGSFTNCYYTLGIKNSVNLKDNRKSITRLVLKKGNI